MSETPTAPLVQEFPAEGIRFTPSVTPDSIANAVLMAASVVALDRQGWDQRMKIARLEQQLEEQRGYAKAASVRADEARRRAYAVQELHAEAETVACADGCCHEGLGYCGFCGEGTPYPCKTHRVAEGKEPATA
jgi:hypothetical protein